MYIKGHVETVDTKDQSNAIVYCVCYVACRHCWYEHQSMQCIECSICRHWCLWLLHNTVYRVMRCENCIDSVDIDSIECIRDPCLVSTVSTYIVLMVWLKSPQSQLSKTFCGLKIDWILRRFDSFEAKSLHFKNTFFRSYLVNTRQNEAIFRWAYHSKSKDN